MRPPHNFPAIPRWGLVAILLGSIGCAHPGPDVLSLNGNFGNGGGASTLVYSMDDLTGDWVGQLVPENLARPTRNFYLRIADGAVNEAADSLGNQWTTVDSQRSLEFSADGAMVSLLESTTYTNNLVLHAQMDPSMSVLSGTFSHVIPSGAQVDGSFSLVRSTGPGHFSQALLANVWDGYGANELGKKRNFTLTLDSAGVVLSGEITHPVTQALVHSYSAAAGTFVFSDDAIGRLDNVVLQGDDGSTATFSYLLVDEQGTLLGGPGFDTLMGSGVIEMKRPAAGPQ